MTRETTVVSRLLLHGSVVIVPGKGRRVFFGVLPGLPPLSPILIGMRSDLHSFVPLGCKSETDQKQPR